MQQGTRTERRALAAVRSPEGDATASERRRSGLPTKSNEADAFARAREETPHLHHELLGRED